MVCSHFKKLSCCVALTTALLSPMSSAQAADNFWQHIQQAGVLRCGAAVAPPYVMRDPKTGQYSGYFADLCRDFGENVLKVKVKIVDATWETQVAGLQSDKWDLALALNQTPERALAVSFSVPAQDFQLSFLINKDNPKFAGAGNKISDYDKEGVTFAVMSGTSQDKGATAVVRKGKILRLPGNDETRLALMSRRADVLVDASDTNHLFALANPVWAKEILPSPALSKQGVSFGMPRTVSYADQQVLNIYLTQRRDTGEIDALVNKASEEVNASNKTAE
ncbi:transporter substrate-binding domain-containing protein [Enterobacter ludwigii]|uniref:transporter substrate-binding domain-containing protein n=2 Tax=Enterobacteriaceae TaxID=543 RepID=UPI0006A5D7F4|nr:MULTISPECIES: transporter substrate-binding domain-containing protein [Enterobacteriaceae]EKS6729912.1 transporter substrate-binding domain-containing protein [Enterobacter mori]EES0030174.1 transporter substrate-binding domain-containing protein [Escherichia coli]MBX8911092.1 transporter substrate-binding domain-containing protein [Enterobacter ludwigii]MCM7781912.1 transporter substrate-binding domain-containing protein [Enterobacter ludwigii]MDE9666240.1 transporter substrate-binding dom